MTTNLMKIQYVGNSDELGSDGKGYNTKFYNLEAVIAVGFRTNSERAITFMNWAGTVLKDFSIRGYVLDIERQRQN